MRKEIQTFALFVFLMSVIAVSTHVFLYIFRIFPEPLHFYLFVLPLVAATAVYFRSKAIANIANNFWEKFTQPFHVSADIKIIQLAVDIARIIAGSAILFTFADSLSYALLLDPAPEKIYPFYLAYIILGALYVLGFLTPLVSMALLFLTMQYNPFAFGILLFRTILLANIFLGAGRSLSLDSALSRIPFFRTILKLPYILTPPLTHSHYAIIRFLLLMLFWGVNLTAMRGHWTDTYWKGGDAVMLMLTTPFQTDWYQIFTSIRNSLPIIFYTLSIIGLILQSIYELLTLPLSFFKLGRMFVAFQMLGFTFVVFSVINIASQVATMQLSLWVLIFFPEVLLWLKFTRNKDLNHLDAVPIQRVHHQLQKIAFILCLYFAIMHLALQSFSFVRYLPFPIYENEWIRPTFSTIGQKELIDVYNRMDIEAPQYYMVIAEVNELDDLIQVVPFTDIYGGRLDYLRSDYAMYKIFVPWTRSNLTNRLPLQDGAIPSRTEQFIRQQVLFDACVRSINAPQRYFAFTFHTPIEQQEYFRAFSSNPSLYAVIEYRLTSDDIGYIMDRNEANGIGCYNLPPNHFYSQEREEQTLLELSSRLETYFEQGGILYSTER